ncbi:hypothetical protein GYA44_01190, partial [Candidatus Microgenomates bacterium]|nr:hypothetical protein [Candidatus Microgenomates bacterium]
MSLPTLLKKNVLYLAIILFLSSCLIFLLQESFGRAIFILFSLILWFLFFVFTKKGLTASILFILTFLSFNVTYQLPNSISFFGTEMILYNPYSNGVFVNYLVPTLSILDLGLFLLTVSILKEVKTEVLRKIFQNVKWYLITFLVFILLQNIFLFDFLVLLNTVRFVIVLLLLICIPTLIKSLKTRSFNLSIMTIFLINTLLQGVIGTLQFLGGSSLGLKWLGESQVVSGMQGSSFIELFDGLYLRAYGTFPHPNILAGFFLLSFFVSVFFFFTIEKKYKWLPTLLFFSSSLVLFTFSRIVICL